MLDELRGNSNIVQVDHQESKHVNYYNFYISKYVTSGYYYV